MSRSAAELTCPCGYQVRIEAGPDSWGNALRGAERHMARHQDGCRLFLAKNSRPEKKPEKYGFPGLPIALTKDKVLAHRTHVERNPAFEHVLTLSAYRVPDKGKGQTGFHYVVACDDTELEKSSYVECGDRFSACLTAIRDVHGRNHARVAGDPAGTEVASNATVRGILMRFHEESSRIEKETQPATDRETGFVDWEPLNWARTQLLGDTIWRLSNAFGVSMGNADAWEDLMQALRVLWCWRRDAVEWDDQEVSMAQAAERLLKKYPDSRPKA